MPTLKEKESELEVKRGEFVEIVKKHRNDDGKWHDTTPELIKEIRERQDEMGKLQDEVKSLESLESSYQETQQYLEAKTKLGNRVTNNFGGGGGQDSDDGEYKGTRILHAKGKSLGQQYVDSAPYKSRSQTGTRDFRLSFENLSIKEMLQGSDREAMKTTMTTGAGIAPYPPRLTEYVPFAVREPVVADLMPNQDTNAPSIIYVEITTWTRNAAAVAEGATKPEDQIQGTQKTVPMTKIATTIPVTEEQLDDVEGIRELIDTSLMSSVRLEEDRELLGGSGSGSEMTGFYNKSGVNSQTFGGSGTGNRLIECLRAMKSVRTVGYSVPDGFVFHPDDWFLIATEQDGQGRFILADPGAEYPKRLWGLPVVETTGATAGTVLTGAFRTWAKVWRKMELRIDTGWANDDYLKNLIRVRAEERAALTIFRPAAFTKIVSFA